MRSRWKRRAKRFILKNILRLPLSFFIKTKFQLSSSSHEVKTKLFHNEELSFDADVLLYELTTGTRGESNNQVVTSKKDSVKKEYNEFTRRLIQAGFFEAIDNVYFEYDGLPKISYTHTYHLHFFWTFNKKVFQSIELIDDMNYGLRESEKEKFSEFRSYLLSMLKK